MGNHVIYDRIWESKKLASCSLRAALAYPWIYLVADDWGRFEVLPRIIWARVFGAREDVKARDVEAWLAEYEKVGLLKIYQAAGRRVGVWTRFAGPPASKRSPSILPDENGRIDTKGLKKAGRFHAAASFAIEAEHEQEQEAEQELEQEAEQEAEREGAPPVPTVGQGVAAVVPTKLDRAQALAAAERDPKAPATDLSRRRLVHLCGRAAEEIGERDGPGWLAWSTATPSGKVIENVYAPHITQAWVDVAISKLEQALRAHEARGQPSAKAREREEGFLASMVGGLKGDGTVRVVDGRPEVVGDGSGVAGRLGAGGTGVRQLREPPAGGEGGSGGGVPRGPGRPDR